VTLWRIAIFNPSLRDYTALKQRATLSEKEEEEKKLK
jgi:hypothetical protein